MGFLFIYSKAFYIKLVLCIYFMCVSLEQTTITPIRLLDVTAYIFKTGLYQNVCMFIHLQFTNIITLTPYNTLLYFFFPQYCCMCITLLKYGIILIKKKAYAMFFTGMGYFRGKLRFAPYAYF